MPKTLFGILVRMALTSTAVYVILQITLWSFDQSLLFTRLASSNEEDIAWVLALGVQFMPTACWIVAYHTTGNTRKVFMGIGWTLTALDGLTNEGAYWNNREMARDAAGLMAQLFMTTVCGLAVFTEEGFAYMLSALALTVNDFLEITGGKNNRIRILEWVASNAFSATPGAWAGGGGGYRPPQAEAQYGVERFPASSGGKRQEREGDGPGRDAVRAAVAKAKAEADERMRQVGLRAAGPAGAPQKVPVGPAQLPTECPDCGSRNLSLRFPPGQPATATCRKCQKTFDSEGLDEAE